MIFDQVVSSFLDANHQNMRLKMHTLEYIPSDRVYYFYPCNILWYNQNTFSHYIFTSFNLIPLTLISFTVPKPAFLSLKKLRIHTS